MACKGSPPSILRRKNSELFGLLVADPHLFHNLPQGQVPAPVIGTHEEVLLLLEKVPDVLLESFLDIWRSPIFGALGRPAGIVGIVLFGLAFNLVRPKQLADIVTTLLVLLIKAVYVVV